VIVTFNSAPWISRAVRAVLASDTPALEVVVVDNASSDGTLAALHEFGESVDVVALDENVGFSRACNLAARRARGEFLLFLNPDTEVRSGSVSRAVAYLREHPGVGVVGGRTFYDDGSTNPTCCFREPSLWSALCSATGLSSMLRRSSLFNPEHMGGWRRGNDREVDVVTGCFLMLRASLFEQLSGFDERFFLYSEDTDLCRRVRERGLTCVHVARVELLHVGGASDSMRSEKVAKVMRAKSQYYEKHWSAPRARLGVALLDVSVVTRLAAHRALRNRERSARWEAVWRQRSEWHPFRAAMTRPVVANGSAPALAPRVPLAPARVSPRLRMAYRWSRHLVRSARSRDYDFVVEAAGSLARLPALVAAEPFAQARHTCNVCNWSGAHFYPNTGPGYHERATTCPGCSSLDRHRSLVAVLASSTSFFEPGTRVVEVAPMRGFEALVRRQPGVDYTSFDLARHAMERGDITAMRYDTDSVDFFVCFHVLEHVADEAAALSEIHRVLRPGGTAVLQVPVDWELAETYEYPTPDPREVGHVRRYGRDLRSRLADQGFDVDLVSVPDLVDQETTERFGLSAEPIFLARNPVA
jgi:GT2 family glycosyltransferase/SAM-dependent methyltransferase